MVLLFLVFFLALVGARPGDAILGSSNIITGSEL
jgi:hypothetical protein